MSEDELRATIARQDQEIAALRTAIDGFRWIGNNLHNAGSTAFDGLFRAALEDARKAMNDDWQPMIIERRFDRRTRR